MDFQTAFNVAMGIGGVLVPLVAKMLMDKIADAKSAGTSADHKAQEAKEKAQEAKDAIARHQLYASETFLTVRRFEGFEERLFTELRGIKERLDEKADKGGH